MAVAAGVHVRETTAPGAWVPHLSLAGDVPEHREAEFRAALDLGRRSRRRCFSLTQG